MTRGGYVAEWLSPYLSGFVWHDSWLSVRGVVPGAAFINI